MKKTSACITALVLSTLMLSSVALSAFAVDVSATEALTVIAEIHNLSYGGYEVLLENGYRLNDEEIQTYLGEDTELKYGDVVSVHNTEVDDNSYPYHYMWDEASEIVYLGTVETYYADSIKELTVTKTLHGALDFTDADGVTYKWEPKAYFYKDHGYGTPEGFDPAAYRVGDVVECAVRSTEEAGRQVIQPITQAPNPVPVPDELDAVTVIATDADGALLSNDIYIYNSEFKAYSGTDRILQHGDVLVEKGAWEVLETFPARYYAIEDFQLEYLGTVAEYYADSLKEMTVTATGDKLVLEDADGVAYSWSDACSDYGWFREFQVPEGFKVSDYQVGDVVTFAVKYSTTYGKYLTVLPVTPAPKHTPIKGDIDGNGTVNIMDVILLNRHLMIGAEISEQGMKNALTYTANDGLSTQSDEQRLPDAVDSLNILKYVVGLISELS